MNRWLLLLMVFWASPSMGQSVFWGQAQCGVSGSVVGPGGYLIPIDQTVPLVNGVGYGVVRQNTTGTFWAVTISVNQAGGGWYAASVVGGPVSLSGYIRAEGFWDDDAKVAADGNSADATPAWSGTVGGEVNQIPLVPGEAAETVPLEYEGTPAERMSVGSSGIQGGILDVNTGGSSTTEPEYTPFQYGWLRLGLADDTNIQIQTQLLMGYIMTPEVWGNETGAATMFNAATGEFNAWRIYHNDLNVETGNASALVGIIFEKFLNVKNDLFWLFELLQLLGNVGLLWVTQKILFRLFWYALGDGTAYDPSAVVETGK